MTALSLDEICSKYGLLKPSRRDRSIHRAPRFGEYYWVDYPHDAFSPEFVGRHPGIVIQAAQSLQDPCTVVPITSSPQELGRHAHKLSINPNWKEPAREVWAVCGHLYTVQLARLVTVWSRQRQPVVVCDEDMDAIRGNVRRAFSRIFMDQPKGKAGG